MILKILLKGNFIKGHYHEFCDIEFYYRIYFTIWALFLLLPWIVGMIYGEYHVALIYLVTAAICFILGKLLSFRHTGRFKEL